jgi:hypothetical protein
MIYLRTRHQTAFLADGRSPNGLFSTSDRRLGSRTFTKRDSCNVTNRAFFRRRSQIDRKFDIFGRLDKIFASAALIFFSPYDSLYQWVTARFPLLAARGTDFAPPFGRQPQGRAFVVSMPPTMLIWNGTRGAA